MMAAASEEDVVTTAPTPEQEEPFQPPTVVNGITEADTTDPSTNPPPTPTPTPNPSTSPAASSGNGVASLLNSLTAKMSEAVRASKTEVTRAVESVVPTVQKAPLPTILLFGDSITEWASGITDDAAPGWAALLSEAYVRKADVLNRGFGGYNSRWALHIFPRIVHGLPGLQNLRVVTIFFGANDAAPPAFGTHVPLDEYKYNLSKLTHFVRALRRMTPVIPILVTPPPIVAAQLASAGLSSLAEPMRTPELAATYASACVRIGAMMKCPVVDVHSAMVQRAGELADGDVQKGLEIFFKDGLHFSSEGNRFFATLLLDTFRKYVPDLVPDEMVPSFPLWSEVNPYNCTESLGTSPLVE